MFNFITNSSLIVQSTENPTHYPENGMSPSYIDLILNKNVRDITDIPDLSTSIPDLNPDHYPVMFQLYNQNKENNVKTVTSYKNTDWDLFRADLSNKTIINNNISTPEEVEKEIAILTKNIIQTKNGDSKKVKIDPDKVEIDQYTVDLIQYRNRLRKLYQ